MPLRLYVVADLLFLYMMPISSSPHCGSIAWASAQQTRTRNVQTNQSTCTSPTHQKFMVFNIMQTACHMARTYDSDKSRQPLRQEKKQKCLGDAPSRDTAEHVLGRQNQTMWPTQGGGYHSKSPNSAHISQQRCEHDTTRNAKPCGTLP